MKRTVAVAAALVIGATLSACGDDSGSGGSGGSSEAASYCDQIQTLKDDFKDLDFTAFSDAEFEDLQGSISDLEAAAPDDIADDWATLGDALEQFQTILSDAGLSLDDLKAMQDDPNNLPEGVDLEALQKMTEEMTKFGDNQDFVDAGDAIQKNAVDECDIDLDDSGS